MKVANLSNLQLLVIEVVLILAPPSITSNVAKVSHHLQLLVMEVANLSNLQLLVVEGGD